MNDSLRTNVFVRFSPETIACACIYLAARQLKVYNVIIMCFCGVILLIHPSPGECRLFSLKSQPGTVYSV